MERRAGADIVELDLIDQWAKVYYTRPRTLDFAVLAEAAESAAYTLMGIEVEVGGRIVQGTCEPCAEEHRFLEVTGTGQRLEYRGPEGEGTELHVHADVRDWEDGHGYLIPLANPGS